MAKLDDLIEQIRGVSYKPIDLHNSLNENSITLLRANNICDEKLNFDDVVFVDRKKVSSTQLLKKGDILICTSSGSKDLVGKAAYVPFDIQMTFGAFCKVVRPKIDCKSYLAHYFQSPVYRRRISEASAGANINNIRNEHIAELEIPLPPLETQKQIAATLDKITALIDMHKRQLKLLEELVKGRFVEMFGDPKSNPNGWKTTTIGALIQSCEAGWSGNGTQREKKSGEIAVLKVSAVTKGFFIPEECKVLDNQNEIKKYIFPQKGDLLFSRANTREMVGATAVIFQDYPELILPDKLWRIRFVHCANVLYMKHILSHQSVRSKFSEASTGTSGSMFNVSMEKFKAIEIPLPEIELQNQFAAFVTQTDKSKSSIQQSLAKLETLKKSLMQEYFG